MRRIIPRPAARRLLHVGMLALAPLAVGCREEPAQVRPASTTAAAPRSAARIVVLGDSLAAGLGLAEDEAFPAVAERLLRDLGHSVDVVNAGVSGDTSAGGVSRVDWVLSQRPVILVVELGGNDALRGQPIQSTEANLREIVRRGRAAGARVVLLGMDIPTSYGPDYGERFAAMYGRIAREEAVTLVPGFVREVGVDPALIQADGLHPTAAGQRALAEKLVPHLASLLDEVGGEP